MGRAHALYEGVQLSPGLFPHLLPQSVVAGFPVSIVQLIAVPMAWSTTDLGRHCDHAFGSLPSAAARSTMARATRSFMLPVGLADSSFAMMRADPAGTTRSEEHTSELQSPCNLVCRLLLEKKKKNKHTRPVDSDCRLDYVQR